MQATTPFVHDLRRCFICEQYRLYIDEFCRINDITPEFADFPFTVAMGYIENRRILFINAGATLAQWLPLAYDLVGLPCLNFNLSDGAVHFGQFLSSN